MNRPLISIVNSSTFGKHFTEHISTLEKFADIQHVTVPADIEADALAEKIRDSDGIIASVTPRFPRKTLEQCTRLKLLVRHGIGCDNVDLVAATELGIPVSRVKGIVEREAVAEYAVALLMAASRLLPQGREAVRNSQWATRSRMIGMELLGKTIGIIGLGNIGSRSAEILSNGFNTNIIASDPYIAKERFKQFNATEVSLKELISRSNAILFHCPLTDETKRMLGKAQFAAMQKGAVLVNTCRGELVDEDALYEALQNGPMSAYATDVVEGEPIDGNHRLAKLDNVIITPHLGGYS
ncbi:MAG: hydroxyacid dehydrogenase, partial [Bacteroidota bacterium]|nr:hydroxyacid dehydrogenase [Bacteroidota bacterium]